MHLSAFESKSANVFNRKLIAFLTVFSLLVGFLILPRQFTPLLPTATAAPTIALFAGSMTALNTVYTENFDGLASTGTNVTWTDNSTLPGWYSSRANYNAGTGNSNTGALYSFGVAGASVAGDRALGDVGSGGTGTVYWGVKLTNNTGATITSIDISFIGEQWRNGGATSPAVSVSQLVDFQYQIASAGVVTAINTPSSNWLEYDPLDFSSPTFGTTAAATLDGNASANRVSKASNLVVNISPGQEIWLRWKDIDHAGNDHGLAIDDFSVIANGSGTPTPTPATNPMGAGSANPSSVAPTQATLLTVAVTPGTNPTSTAHTVSANLSSIGGSPSQALFDDGSNGDATPNDKVFSYLATLAGGTTGGAKTLPFTIQEVSPSPLARTASGNISLTVVTPTSPAGTGTANPSSPFPGDGALFTVNITPGTNPASTGLTVSADLSAIGGSPTQLFSGSGNTFTFNATVGAAVAPGVKSIPFTVTDSQSRSGSGSISLTVQAPPPVNNVVISQVYGGGGNSGASLTNDFIELINRSDTPVSLNGWSVQAFVSTTNTWQVTPLPNFTLQPGQYFLIQESRGEGGADSLPAPDAAGTIPVSSTGTSVALLNNSTQLPNICPGANPGLYGIVDLVGYGAPTFQCREGSASAPTTDNLTADSRRDEGCFDTNDNAADFILGEPSPRNSSSPTHDCSGLFGYGSANPASVAVGNSVALSVRVLGGQNPASTGIAVTADLSSIGGPSTQSFSGGDNSYAYTASVPVNTSGGFKSLPVTISDSQGRSVNTTIVVSVLPLIADHITISQIYGAGGNNINDPFRNDYVELYNPTASPVSITGWSIQYASAAGTSWTNKQPIGGLIGPGEYLLVALASGGSFGAPLPPAQINGSLNISGTAGKIALVKNSDNLASPCPLGTDPDLVDFVGYGSASNCHEGTANAPAPSDTNAIFRKSSGSQDTDQNGNDFTAGAPNPRQTAPIIELGPWVAGNDPGTNSSTIPHDATVQVDFSEPVNVDAGWYNINCSQTGSHNDATVGSAFSSKTYAVTPNVNFAFGEQCTVTIYKAAIHDQDVDDSGADTDSLLDDYTWSFTVVGAGQPAPYAPSVHLTMGNPGCGTNAGCATADTGNPNNYLMEKPTYSLSYNRDKGTPNWVSWHLDDSWYGNLARVDTFRADPAVPADWYRVESFDYSSSGFDRGHMTPNADRNNATRVPINQETYLMTNMIPQAPNNNQGPWAAMEAELRTQAGATNELYIVAGPSGVGGVGSASGNVVNTIAGGRVTVPAATWKVVLVLPKQDGDDLSRVTCSTKTIAVIMPNIQSIGSDWHNYITTIDAVEQLTGYNFFSNLPENIQGCLEAGTNGINAPGTAGQTVSTFEDTAVTITLEAVRPNNNTPTFSTVSGPQHGTLGAVSATACSADHCTATVTYTPNPEYDGLDGFTFKAADGALNSNTSNVSITVNPVNDAPTAVNLNAGETYTEDTALDLADIFVADVDGPSITATLTLSDAGTGSLSTVSAGNATAVFANGVWTVTGTVADVNSVLAAVSFIPATNYTANFSIATSVSDGIAPPLVGSKAITGVGVNDAPVLDASKTPTLVSVNEDPGLPLGSVGTLVSSLVDFATPGGQVDNVTEVDAGASLGVAITAVDPNLACFYSLNNGVNWVSMGEVSPTSARLLAANASDRIYCQPGLNLNGTFSNALTFRAWDTTVGVDGSLATTSPNGGTSAFSLATDGISLTAIAVNDPPTATNLNAAETYTEDTPLNFIDIVVADVDTAQVSVTLTLSNPTAGSLTTGTSGSATSTYNTGTGVWTAAGNTSDVNVLLAAVTFEPAPNYNGGFTIATAVSDEVAPAVTGSKGMAGTAVNDAPVLDSTKSPALVSVNEDAGAPAGAAGTLVADLVDFVSPAGQVDNVMDVDAGALLGIAITGIDPGLTCFYSLNNGTAWTVLGPVSNTSALLLTANGTNRLYCRAGANSNGTYASALTFKAWDRTTGADGGLQNTSVNGGTEAFSAGTDTISLFVVPVNDDPGISNITPVSQTVQYSDPIAEVTLSSADIDSPGSSLTATVQWMRLGDNSFGATAPLGGMTLTANTPGTSSRSWTLAGRALVGEGTYVVRVTVSDGEGGSVSRDITVNVAKETTRIEYTGTQFILLPTAGSNGTATLSATVTEDADASLGNLAGSQLQFYVYKSTDVGLSSPVAQPVCSLVDTGTTGTATCSTSQSLPADSYIVKVQLASTNSYYSAPVETATLSISDPGMTTGGGWLVDPNDASGNHSNFSFSVKYQKNESAKGNSAFTYRSTANLTPYGAPAGLRDYNFVIRSTAMGDLRQSTTTSPRTATFGGKCTIKAIDRLTGVTYDLGGNYSFQVDVTDGTTDRYAIRVLNPSGTNFVVIGGYTGDTNTSQLSIGGGNIKVD
jgi:DNA/RNA endonuclease G (NUC1)